MIRKVTRLAGRLNQPPKLLAALVTLIVGSIGSVHGQSPRNSCVLVATQGEVLISLPGQTNLVTAVTNQPLVSGTRIRTGTNGSAAIRFGNQSIQRLGPNSAARVLDPTPRGGVRQFLERGLHYFFDRDEDLEVNTSTTSGLTLGTEFVVQVDGEGQNETVEVTLFEGGFELQNSYAKVKLGTGQQARSEPGKPPFLTSAIYSTNAIQWCLYYPAVLDPAELNLSAGSTAMLSSSLALYRAGDLVGAFTAWPPDRVPVGPPERLYHVALQLGIGNVAAARIELDGLPVAGDAADLANALRRLLSAVTTDPTAPDGRRPATSSGLLAESYFAQSRRELDQALQLARDAVAQSPEFAFGWARVAELQLGRGDLVGTSFANRRARELAPRHAQAVAVEGFLLAAQNRTRRARETFSQAIALNARLGNAWLGRGLCQFRLGEMAAGLADLEMAAAMEPTRAALRATLAKAWYERGQVARARTELGLAERLDRLDPTIPYYAALQAYGENRINAAIGNLEDAIALNDNRAVFRPQAQLDEDRAVRGTGLARLYQRAGLTDVSLREAARAVANDYTDYSSHLFLAETYDALRDPTRFNLRQETAWFNELLLADLLAPVGAGTFSPNISQQEYSRLFAAEGVALSTVSDYRSDGQWRQLATQSGFFGATAWSLDLDYQQNDGVRPNNSLDRIEWYSQVKHQVSAQDTALVLVKYQDYRSGDNFQYLNPLDPLPGRGFVPSFQYYESQAPIAVGGWRHEWSPGIQTLALAGRLENDQRFHQDNVALPLQITHETEPVGQGRIPADLDYRSRLEIYTGELSQIVRLGRHTLVVGGRAQRGGFNTTYQLASSNFLASLLFDDEFNRALSVSSDFERWSVYGYETWSLWPGLSLTAGVAYETLHYPQNFRAPPLRSGESSRFRALPKAAIVWNPLPPMVLRGIYAQSLGGVSLEESYRLEPAQLAGFSQAFRTLIPESLVGSVSAPRYEVAGVAMDFKLPARIYLGLRGDALRSRVVQDLGNFEFDEVQQVPGVDTIAQRLKFREESATLTVDKLWGDEWALGGVYRYQTTELDESFAPPKEPVQRAELHEFSFHANWNHRAGWFGRAESRWLLQTHENATAVSGEGNDNTCQLNVQFGWRFPRQKGEVSLGILNLVGADYRLAPLSGLPEFARDRVFFGRLKLYF